MMNLRFPVPEIISLTVQKRSRAHAACFMERRQNSLRTLCSPQNLSQVAWLFW